MTCPVCGGKNHVVDTRQDIDAVYRKRICKECGHEFFTVEFETESTDEFKRLARERYHKK
jgi:transcriptional regulator NrdR family protein